MIRIEKPKLSQIDELVDLARITLVQSHGHSAPKAEIDKYLDENYTESVLKKELLDVSNIYHVLFYKDVMVGFSKLILNQSIDPVTARNIAKLQRIYLLNDYQGLGLAKTLLDFNISILKANKQVGMWLFVWVENKRAIRFYEKNNFITVGEYDFKVSENHYNPNWQMYLEL